MICSLGIVYACILKLFCNIWRPELFVHGVLLVNFVVLCSYNGFVSFSFDRDQAIQVDVTLSCAS